MIINITNFLINIDDKISYKNKPAIEKHSDIENFI